MEFIILIIIGLFLNLFKQEYLNTLDNLKTKANEYTKQLKGKWNANIYTICNFIILLRKYWIYISNISDYVSNWILFAI